MAKIKFEYSDNELNREAKSIEIEFPDDVNMGELKTIFIRLSSALGYTETTIKNSLGESNTVKIDIEDNGRPNFGPEVDGNIEHGEENRIPLFDPENSTNFHLRFGLDELLNNLNIDKLPDDE